MKTHAVLLSVFLMISKAFGLIRELVLAKFYGANLYADAFLTAATIPDVFFGLLASGIVSSFIPVYTEILEKESRQRSDLFFNRVLTFTFLITISIILLSYFFTNELVLLLAKGFSGEALEVTSQFVKINLLSIALFSVVKLYNGYQEIYGLFIMNPLLGIISNVIIIICIILSVYQPLFLPLGLLLSSMTQFLISSIVMNKKIGFRFKPEFNTNDKYLKKLIIIALPIIIGSSINQVNHIIDKTMASGLGTGSVSILNYASIISESVVGVFGAAIATVALPNMSKFAVQEKHEDFSNVLTETIRLVFIIIIPASFGIIIFSEEIVSLLFGRGSFLDNPETLLYTAKTLQCIVIGSIGYTLRNVFSSSYYAKMDSLTPVKSALIAIVINISLNSLFIDRLGVIGLGLATSISGLVGSFLLYIELRKSKVIKKSNSLLKNLLITIFSSIVMSLISRNFYEFLIKFLGTTPSLFISIILAVAVYFFMLYLFKVDELQLLISNNKN